MNLERDKFLTEAMGECWHEHTFGTCPSVCCKCKIKNKVINEYGEIYQGTNFSTWAGFGKLWEWASRQHILFGGYNSVFKRIDHQITEEDVNPNRFADAVYSYLKEKAE